MPLVPAPDPRAIPLHVLDPDGLAALAATARTRATRAWVEAHGLRGRRSARRSCLPGPDGAARGGAGRLGHGRGAARATASTSPAPPPSFRPGATRCVAEGVGVRRRDSRRWAGCSPSYRFERYRAAQPRRRPSSSAPTASTPARIERDRRGGGAGAGPHQHARPRHGAGGAGGRLRRRWPGGTAPRSRVTRGAAALRAANLPMIARGRRRRRPRRRGCSTCVWGRAGRAEGHPGRQGRLLRHRRARHQAAGLDGADEEGHGRRRDRDGPRATW